MMDKTPKELDKIIDEASSMLKERVWSCYGIRSIKDMPAILLEDLLQIAIEYRGYRKESHLN